MIPCNHTRPESSRRNLTSRALPQGVSRSGSAKVAVSPLELSQNGGQCREHYVRLNPEERLEVKLSRYSAH